MNLLILNHKAHKDLHKEHGECNIQISNRQSQILITFAQNHRGVESLLQHQ